MKGKLVTAKFLAAAAIFVVISIAVLLMATAAYALPAPTSPPCYNRVQDSGEKGVDCGGLCASPSLIEFCDGKDNDKDCMIDEECKNWSLGNTNSLDGLGASEKARESGGKPQSLPLGYQPFKAPQPEADTKANTNGIGLVGHQFSVVAMPAQKAPDIPTSDSIPLSQADGSQVDAEPLPAKRPQEAGTAAMTENNSYAEKVAASGSKAAAESDGNFVKRLLRRVFGIFGR